jgi:hypothetical protein
LQVHSRSSSKRCGGNSPGEEEASKGEGVGEENAPMIKIWSGFLVVKVKGKLKIFGTGENIEIYHQILIFPVNC